MPNEPSQVDLRLRAAVESSPSGLLMVDSTGTIVLVNREVERLFGYSREELLGKPLEILIPHEYRQRHPEFRNSFIRDPKVRAMGAGRELFGLRKDGKHVPVEIGLTPVVTDEGLFVLSSVVDISARKQAEARFRSAVELAPNGMVMIDAQGTIILVNKEAERLFGYDRQEVLGRSIELLVPERFRKGHPGFRSGFYHSPQARPMGAGRELFGLRKDGTEIPIEIGLNPIETDEGVFVLSSIVDISARKQAQQERERLEEQLRQAQKMEAVGTLAGGVAHDFNNILGSVIGYAEMALAATRSSGEASIAGDLEEVLRSALRGRELVDRILRFSRRQETQRRPADLTPMVTETARLLRATFPASVEIKLRLQPNVPQILADATSVQQIIMNLATNGAHAMPHGGDLEIGVEAFYVRDSVARANPTLHEGPYALLTVRDSGHGMEESVRARAFEPFFTTKPLGSGSGLGLAMVHGIVREHEGDVQIESAPGKGTTIKCFFPAVTLEPTAVEAESLQSFRGAGERILYLDDEPGLTRLGERRLSGLGYAVIGVTSPLKALEALTADPSSFDLVITDYSMPRLNGVELARRIVALRAELPIILLTGYLEDFTSEELTAAGIRRLIKKPVTERELAECVYGIFHS